MSLALAVALASFLAAPAGAMSAHARHAIKPEPKVQVTGTVLFGSPAAFTALATVDRRQVFESIPAYQAIVREKLSRRSPRYHFLLKQANDVFRRALLIASRDNGVDLVVDAGGVTALGLEVTDMTSALQQVIHGKRKGSTATPAGDR